MDSTTLLVVLGVFALVMVLLVVGALIWMVKNRPPGKGVAAAIAALAYAISPVDVVPEVLLGPIGLVDDLAVIVATFLYVRRTIDEVRRNAVTGRSDQPYQIRPSHPSHPTHPTHQPRGRALRDGVPHQDDPPGRQARS